MAQPNFKDPIVSAGPTLTGTGNGTLAVDKLTHFTVEQDYDITCISVSPDVLFSVVGSLDGAVGIAKVGTQFFDDDLKIFFTIQQGSTPFVVGDKFELSVENGTDLHQDNIDDYDEQPQKNFGEGVKGTLSGDNNIRYDDDALSFASLRLQGLKFIADTGGDPGEDIQIEYLVPVPAVAASQIVQDLTFEADTAGAAGNGISIEYLQFTPAVKALLVVQDLTYQADVAGAAGNSITIEYTTGGTAGAEGVSVLGNAITVQIQSGVSTATQVKAAIDGFPAAAALVDVSISGTGGNFQTAPTGPTALAGGSDAVGNAGSEVVQVTSLAITVQLESGVSTATQVKAAIDGFPAAAALVNTTISGVGSNPQSAPAAAVFLAGGADAIGDPTPFVQVTGNLIQVRFSSGVATASEVKAALDGSAPAMALISVELTGPGSDYQFSPVSATNLAGGNEKFFSFNKHELTESGDFSEGNASVRVQDAVVQGRASISQEAEISGKVTLKESSSAVVPDAQQYINWLMQDHKVSLRTSDHSKVQWNKPDLAFEADIIVDFNDTDINNKIAVADSPISIADGQSLYVILDRANTRYVTPIVANTVPQSVNAFRICSRFGDHIILWDNTLIRDGKAVRIGEGGGDGGGTVRVDLYDPVATVLPTGPIATIDGVSLANDMLVLFSNLSSGNNRIYKAAGVGTSITWTAQSMFTAGLDVSLSETVLPSQGTSFGLRQGIFDGSDFLFNDTVRYFNGTDYWEVSSLKYQTMVPNTTDEVFNLNVAGSENIIIDYSIVRGSRKEVGTMHITSDGTTAVMSISGTNIDDCGVGFQVSVTAGVLYLEYIADNTAGTPTMKYYLRRWADGAGGPGGPPSYSYSGGSGIVAAGSNTQIQFNDAGDLGADPAFTWDKTNNVLGLNGLEIAALSAAVVLTDNTASPATIITYDASTYPFVIIEYSIQRDSSYEVGRMLITNNGTIVSLTSDFAIAGAASGITFSAVISGSDVEIRYVSTATGFNGSFKYSMRRWA